MAQWSLNQYFSTLYDALHEYDGEHAAELLSFKHPHVANTRLQLERPENSVQRVFEPPYDELVAAHLRCCWAVGKHDFMEAYHCQSIVMQAFTKIFQSQKDENWSLPILFVISIDLRVFAVNADIEAVKRGKSKPGERLEKAAELLMNCFRVCASDNRASIEDTKKWGMLNIVNQLFKIYFKINKLHLCKPLIRAIDSLPIKDKFSLSQLVTFRYYVGRKAMFDSDFKSADEYLTFAFERCHRAIKKNKRLILIYLIPVKMLLGQMPKPGLLEKYDLMAFADVAKGVGSGNLLLLNEALQKNEAFFIKCGIYLILEKLKVITYRNLFKKVYHMYLLISRIQLQTAHAQICRHILHWKIWVGNNMDLDLMVYYVMADQDLYCLHLDLTYNYLILKTHQLAIESFTAALRLMRVEDIDNDETACILANLIYENKIKGYISHQHQKLVVSKQNPFPQLSTVI